jgi:rSAM/selenodomain-associated transferase 2
MSNQFSIIIPVLHEAAIINQAIEHVYSIGKGFDLEIIVVDGDRGGSTINVVTNKHVITLTSPKGRGIQLNRGASVARGDILLFLHIDTELPADALRTIACITENGQYIGGAFDLGIQSGSHIFRLIERMVYIRTRLTGIPYGDQAIFMRKDFFETMKGFKEIPIMEDVELMRRLKERGHRICIIPQKVKTSPRRWEKEGVLYCTLRNWILISLYFLGIKPEKLVKWYYYDRA